MTLRTVANRFIPFDIIVPAGTSASAPMSTNPNVGDVILVAVRLVVPPGHAGFTGFRVDYASSTILPYSNPPGWIITDDDKEQFPVGIEVGSSLRLVTYNTDILPHRFLGQLQVTDIIDGAAAPTQLVPITAS